MGSERWIAAPERPKKRKGKKRKGKKKKEEKVKRREILTEIYKAL